MLRHTSSRYALLIWWSTVFVFLR